MTGALVEIVVLARDGVVVVPVPVPVPVMFVCTGTVVTPGGCVGIVVGSQVVFASVKRKGHRCCESDAMGSYLELYP